MKVTLVGFKSVDFKDDNGDRVKGIKLFIAYPDDNTVGLASDGKFIRDNVFAGFGITPQQLADSVDCIIDIEFGMKNKVVGISLLDNAPVKTEQKKAG